jgi:IS30 family transposase
MRHASANKKSPLRQKVKEIADMMCWTHAAIADELGIHPNTLSTKLRNNDPGPVLLSKLNALHAQAMAQKAAHAKIDKKLTYTRVVEKHPGPEFCNAGNVAIDRTGRKFQRWKKIKVTPETDPFPWHPPHPDAEYHPDGSHTYE